MPTFAHPWFFLLLPLVPLVLWWWLRQRRTALRYPALVLFAGLPPGRSRVARWGGVGLRSLFFLCLILAVTGPRWPDQRTRIRTEGIALEFLLDVSGSMAEPDFSWQGEPISRLDAARRAFRLFVEGGQGPGGETLPGRPDDLIGLVAFGTRPESTCPLTLSHSVLLKMLDEEKPRSIPGEAETNVSDAVVLGLHRLQGATPQRKVLILVSDGEHNVPNPQSHWTPRQAAQIAANLGVPIYAIDAGGTGDSPLELPANGESNAASADNRAAGIRTLREVAKITSGGYFQAHDGASLLDVCRKIDEAERTPIVSFQYRRYHEAYPWFGLAALVTLLGLHWAERTFWHRLP